MRPHSVRTFGKATGLFFLFLLGLGFALPSLLASGERLSKQTQSPSKPPVRFAAKAGDLPAQEESARGFDLLPVARKLATPSATDSKAAQSPFEGQIAFRSDREGGGLFVMTPDGTEVQSLPDPALYTRAADREPFAPDNRRLVVARFADGQRDLWIQDVQSEWSEPLLTTPEDEFDPVWSPDGEAIAYVAVDASGQHTLSLLDLTTGQRRSLLSWPDASIGHPSWSPDGKALAFWSDYSTGRRQIWVLELAGGEPRILASSPFNDWDPIWLKPPPPPQPTPTPGGPDDLRLRLLVEQCSEEKTLPITLEAADVSGRHPVTRVTVEADGLLLFDSGPIRESSLLHRLRLATLGTSFRAELTARAWNDGFFTNQPKEVRAVVECRPPRRVSSRLVIPTPPIPSPTLTPTPTPTPTPAGPTPTPIPPETLVDSILFWSDEGGQEALFLLDPRTLEVQRFNVPRAQAFYKEAVRQEPFAPDHNLVAFSHNVEAEVDLFVYNLKSNWAWQLVSSPALEYAPAWSPDGRTIAFTARQEGRDIIMLVDFPSGTVRPLTADLPGNSRHPSWSPDGRALVFVLESEGRSRLWLINADGSNPRPISPATANAWNPVWVKEPPRPPDVVTRPFIVVTNTPTPENIYVAATRVALATRQAATTGTPTPTPPNLVTATPTPTPIVVTLTPTPGNQATATAVAVLATVVAATTGTPTPYPEGARIVTATPSPTPTPTPSLTPTPTPTPTPVIIALADLTPTPRRPPPTPTPTGIPEVLRGKIAFKSDRLGQEAILVLDPATGELSLLTNPWPYEWAQAREQFSPDGRRRVFVRFVDDNDAFQLFIFDYDLNAEVQLTRFGRETRAWDPAWSPRGDRIAFTSNDTGNDEIWVINVDGTGAVHLTDNTWEWDRHPSWSPDGSQIVFSSNRISGWQNIWIMDADGKNPRNLSGWCECNEWDPVWFK